MWSRVKTIRLRHRLSRSACISLLLDCAALLYQNVERLDVDEKQAVIDHVLIVGSQFGQRAVIRYELEPAGDGGVIVDDIAMRVLLCKEHALVIGNCPGECFVRDGCLCEAGGIKSSHVMPVTSEAVTTTECALGAKDVNRRGLLPKGPLGAHDLRCCGGKLHRLKECSRIAADGARLAGLAGGAGTELQH